MSILKEIYTAPFTITSDGVKIVTVSVIYNGTSFIGVAQLHPKDAGYFSPKIGQTIALSRARTNILKLERKRLQKEYRSYKQFYNQVTQKNTQSEIVDPVGCFGKRLVYLHKNYLEVERQIKEEKDHLKNYLSSQEEFIKRITSLRQRTKPIPDKNK